MIKLFNKYKELINYTIGGITTTILHIVLFATLTFIGIKYYIANIITLIAIKTLSYFINKIFVFKTKCKNKKELIEEVLKYTFSRLFTMIIDYFGLIFLVEILNIKVMIGKIIVLILVVLINYILCKKYVYKEDKNMLEKIKKHWFILAIILIGLIRFLFTYKLPNFYLTSSLYDDKLMMDNLNFLTYGKYLGEFGKKTLVKGPMFSFILFCIRLYKIKISAGISALYILSSLYFVLSLKKIINNKKFLIIVYILLLFNPASYSQDLFQRLYRNSISIIEMLLLLGSIIRVLYAKDKRILNYLLLGVSLSLLFLTREDNIWVYPVLLFIPIYTFIKNKNIKTILLNTIPFIILFGSLNIISLMNYKHYGIYTYNEIQKSEFHNTYKKILQIKDDEKKETISIPKSTIYKLSDYTETFNLSREEIDRYYDDHADTDGEIYNGNIIWLFRDMIYQKNKFKSGKESEDYFKKLGKEIDELFKNGTLKKEFIMPSIFMSVPTNRQLKEIPKSLINAIFYVTKYSDIKVMTKTDDYKYSEFSDSYYFKYIDYHYTINIVDKNPIKYEIIRLIYEYFTILFSLVSLVIYFKNIFKLDNISILSHILVVSYGLIIGGVVYTHVTSFHAIRPIYLGYLYILQSIFIMINIYRFISEKQMLK